MNGGAHFAIGAGSTALALAGLKALGVPLDTAALATGSIVAGVGALAPDLDHPRSTASSGLPRKLMSQAVQIAAPLIIMVVVFGLFGSKSTGASIFSAFAPLLSFSAWLLGLSVLFFGASGIIRATTGHRGATHSFVFCAVAMLVACVVSAVLSRPVWFGLAFGWGWLTHLGADALTHMGLPSVFWPFGTQSPAITARELGRPLDSQPPVRPWSFETAVARPAMPSSPAPATPTCPRCGTPMVLRTARRGSRIGGQFYGCSNYPRCRHTQPVGSDHA